MQTALGKEETTVKFEVLSSATPLPGLQCQSLPALGLWGKFIVGNVPSLYQSEHCYGLYFVQLHVGSGVEWTFGRLKKGLTVY